jgi:pimeloyl-ACP methyl ester carboxylesterase
MSGLARALVGAGFRVVAYDAPAHGESTGRFASLPEFARALADVAEALGKIHGLFGHSLGGAAVAMKASSPSRRGGGVQNRVSAQRAATPGATTPTVRKAVRIAQRRTEGSGMG